MHAKRQRRQRFTVHQIRNGDVAEGKLHGNRIAYFRRLNHDRLSNDFGVGIHKLAIRTRKFKPVQWFAIARTQGAADLRKVNNDLVS